MLQLQPEGTCGQAEVCQPGSSDLRAEGPSTISVRNPARIRLSPEDPHHQGDGNQEGVSSHHWATLSKGEEPRTCGLKREDPYHKGARSQAGRCSLRTQDPYNKNDEESSSWNLLAGGP